MSFLKAKLESSQGVPVHMPANGEEISIERAGGGGFSGGGGGGGRARHQRVFGAVAAPSVAAAVVGKMTTKKKKAKLESSSSPLDDDGATGDPVIAAGEAVDAGWRPSPAHSALVELVLRPRRGGGFGVGLAGDESAVGDDSDEEEKEESDGDDDQEGSSEANAEAVSLQIDSSSAVREGYFRAWLQHPDAQRLDLCHKMAIAQPVSSRTRSKR